MRMSRAQAYLMPGYKPDVVTQGTLNPKAPACIAEVPATPASSKARQWASRFGGALLLRCGGKGVVNIATLPGTPVELGRCAEWTGQSPRLL